LVGLVCALCAGMFNALNSLQDETWRVRIAKGRMNAIMYFSFAVFSLIAAALNNTFGPRIMLCFAGATYAMFVGSKLSMHKSDVSPQDAAFAYASSVLLGIGSACLWAAQGQVVMTYPTDEKRGTYFAYFWIIFNLGAVVCSLIALAETFLFPSARFVQLSTTVYITFTCLPALASLLALGIGSPNAVVREDESRLAVRKSSVWRELVAVLKHFGNPAMLILVIPFASSQWFYQYQFNIFQRYFEVKTQALNNTLFWTTQMLASWIMGNLVLDDLKYGGRIRRAWIGFGVIVVSTIAMWGPGAVYQYYIDDFDESPGNLIDFTKSSTDNWIYWGFGALMYMAFGTYDAIFQAYNYWLMGALSHDAAINSRSAGFYKCVQSLFAGLSW
ncbi:major facilitator superfamily domain-containing protein, partial [Chytriomyces sp. MP71]